VTTIERNEIEALAERINEALRRHHGRTAVEIARDLAVSIPHTYRALNLLLRSGDAMRDGIRYRAWEQRRTVRTRYTNARAALAQRSRER
jgi:hypothetical protein